MSCTCSHGPYTVTIPVGYQFTGVSSEFLIVQYCTVFVCVCEVIQFQMSATICCSYGIADDCLSCSLISQ